MLPPCSAGLQLPSDSAYHMAQTDVNTAFHRILAPNGMSDFSFCPAGPLNCSCVKVLKFQIIAKETLDAADLQVSEVEADASKQVFSGLQLDHKPGVLSLEASRIWRLRRGLAQAARQIHLTGDQVAKFTGHITWSCKLRRPALSLINAGYRLHVSLEPRSGRLWPAVAQEFRWIASLLPLLSQN